MTTSKANRQPPTAVALKAERERDKAMAMRDYEDEKLARQANMMRLRALRLAKESAQAAQAQVQAQVQARVQATTARRPAKKKTAIRVSVPTHGSRSRRQRTSA
jgi:hypothetical protein